MKTEKIKNVLKSEYLIIAIITLVALFIRLLNIDKSTGLWWDESLTYFISAKNPLEIIKTLYNYDYHMPLYYLYVHYWMNLFGAEDTVLRYSSVIWGVLTIPAFFYLGKTYRSKALGYFLAIIVCLNPLMIYYSQEVRFYSLLVLLDVLSLIFFLRLIDAPRKKDFVLFGVFNLLILYTYTMGILFVAIEFLLLLVYFYLYRRNEFKSLVKYSMGFFVLSVPYLILLCTYLIASKQAILDPFSWTNSNLADMLSVTNDWFSPFLASVYESSSSRYLNLMRNPTGAAVLFLFSIPSLCLLIGFIRGLKSIDRRLVCLLTILFGIMAVEIYLTRTDSFILITRYTLIFVPIIFLIGCDGLTSIQNTPLKRTLISLIFIVFIYNTINYQKAPSFQNRLGLYKESARVISRLETTPKDYVLFLGGNNVIKKYLKNTKYIEMDVSAALYLDKTKKEAAKFYDQEFILTTNKKNAKDKLLPILKETKPSVQSQQFLESEIKKIPPKGRLIFIDSFCGNNLDKKQLKDLIESFKTDKEAERHYPYRLYLLTYTKIFNDIKTILETSPSLKFTEVLFVVKETTDEIKQRVFVFEKQ